MPAVQTGHLVCVFLVRVRVVEKSPTFAADIFLRVQLFSLMAAAAFSVHMAGEKEKCVLCNGKLRTLNVCAAAAVVRYLSSAIIVIIILYFSV